MTGRQDASGLWPLVARDAELRLVRDALAGTPPRGTLVVGSAGVGKTAFVRRCLRAPGAAAPGAVRWVFGSPATAAVPLGAFVPVLPDLPWAAYPDRALHEAYRALLAQAGGAPLLVVDDAHALDELSALLVHQLATAGGVPVLVTARSGVPLPEPVADLWKDGVLVRIELGPLDGAAVGALLAATLDGPFSLELPHVLERASGGNPLYLRELLAAARESGALHRTDGTWQLAGPLPASGRLGELVEARLATVTGPAREALELVALGEPLELADLPGALDDRLLADLETAGFVRVLDTPRGGALRIAQPVHGEVLRGALPALRARRLNRALAEAALRAPLTTDRHRERVVRWSLAGGLAPRPDDLLAAARSALAHSDVAFARQCAAEAYEREPSATAGVALAEAHVLAAEHGAAEDVLAALEATAVGPDVLAVARARAANLYHWLDRPADARAVLARAAERAGDADARGRIGLLAATLDVYDGRPAAARAAVEDGLAHGDPAVAAAAALVGGLAAMSAGRFSGGIEVLGRASALLAGAPRRAAGTAVDPSLHEATGLFMLLRAGRLTELQTSGEALHRRAIEAGEAATRGWAAYTLGAAALLRGLPRTAERWFRESVAAMLRAGGGSRAYVAGTGVAHALALAGDAEAAAAALADAERASGRRWPVMESEAVRARAWVRACSPGGGRDLTDGLVLAARECQARGGFADESDLLHDAVRLGARASDVLARLAELPSDVDGGLAAARGAHAGALLAGDPDLLRTAAGLFEDGGAYLLAAEAAAHGAATARARGLDRDAVGLDRLCRSLAARGEDPRSPALTAAGDGPGLTDRELEIARLVADGLGSRAVAEKLHLSSRTVDNCLGRVFTKLGIAGRADLGPALADLGL